MAIDAIGYLPFGRDEANSFFNDIANRYEHGCVIATSNLPVSQWSSALADDQTLTAALLDRLLYHAYMVQIARNSYRLGGKKTAGIVPSLNQHDHEQTAKGRSILLYRLVAQNWIIVATES